MFKSNKQRAFYEATKKDNSLGTSSFPNLSKAVAGLPKPAAMNSGFVPQTNGQKLPTTPKLSVSTISNSIPAAPHNQEKEARQPVLNQNFADEKNLSNVFKKIRSKLKVE